MEPETTGPQASSEGFGGNEGLSLPLPLVHDTWQIHNVHGENPSSGWVPLVVTLSRGQDSSPEVLGFLPHQD